MRADVNLMAFGSYFRFLIGILLSIEVLRIAFTGDKTSWFAIGMAILFLLSSALFFAKRMS